MKKTTSNTISLTTLKPGEQGVIDHIQSNPLKTKLMEMGFFHGKAVTMHSKAPFGDPIIVVLSGYKLMLRKKEAGLIILKEG